MNSRWAAANLPTCNAAKDGHKPVKMQSAEYIFSKSCAKIYGCAIRPNGQGGNTMKDEIMRKINEQEPFIFLINNFTALKFYKDTIFRNRWWLRVEFYPVNGIQYRMGHRFIDSRDWEGIVEEVGTAINDYMKHITLVEVSGLKNCAFGTKGSFLT